jgi:hypothetical protein
MKKLQSIRLSVHRAAQSNLFQVEGRAGGPVRLVPSSRALAKGVVIQKSSKERLDGYVAPLPQQSFVVPDSAKAGNVIGKTNYVHLVGLESA